MLLVVFSWEGALQHLLVQDITEDCRLDTHTFAALFLLPIRIYSYFLDSSSRRRQCEYCEVDGGKHRDFPARVFVAEHCGPTWTRANA